MREATLQGAAQKLEGTGGSRSAPNRKGMGWQFHRLELAQWGPGLPRRTPGIGLEGHTCVQCSPRVTAEKESTSRKFP